jgi:hypothetical protein
MEPLRRPTPCGLPPVAFGRRSASGWSRVLSKSPKCGIGRPFVGANRRVCQASSGPEGDHGGSPLPYPPLKHSPTDPQTKMTKKKPGSLRSGTRFLRPTCISINIPSRLHNFSKLLCDNGTMQTNERVTVNKSKLDYWVDVAIGVAGLGSAISGLLLLWPADLTSGVLGISLRSWSTLHTWSSLLAVAGVGVHLALHWKWMIAMTRRMLPAMRQRPVAAPAAESAHTGPEEGSPISRRAFLAIGGTVAVVAGLAAAGYKVLAGAASVEDGQANSLSAETGQVSGVACPRGLVNDPYPGQCRYFVDSDGDGTCDYSVPGSGSLSAANGGGAFEGGFSQRRGNWGRP